MMSPAQKKCVEIVRAMMSDCKLLILDEPTASLSDKETNLLFSIVRNLKAKGTSVLYVTHRLEEIMELTDRVTVLRNGTLVSTVDMAGTSRKELVRLMSGNEAASGVEDAETGKDAESKLQGGAADSISGKGGVKQPVSSEAEKTDTQGAELLGTGADGKIGKQLWKFADPLRGRNRPRCRSGSKDRADHRNVRSLRKWADRIPGMHLRNEKVGRR